MLNIFSTNSPQQQLKGRAFSFFHRIAALISASLVFTLTACADRPYYNDKKVPTAEDLMEIEKSLKNHLAKARAATVCIQMGQGSGSGVIISEEGLILTAAHVSSGVGKEMTVVMEDGTKYKAISLGLHSETDAAMMKIVDKGKYPFVEIDKGETSESATTKLGDWVFSLGHSGGYNKDRGSVVRLGRIVRIADYTVQSDCRLIGGDSGGPLFDMNGVLVGIHSRVGKVVDMNMHVPMHVYNENWDRMMKDEFIGEGPFAKKPVLGGGFIGIAVELDAGAGGLKITDIDKDSAAMKKGVKIGDILTAIDGKKITEKKQIAEQVKLKSVGDSLELTLLRNQKELKITVKLGER